MNVSKEVYNKIKGMIAKEISDCKYKLRNNKYEINKLAKEQRIMKAQIGELYKLEKLIK